MSKKEEIVELTKEEYAKILKGQSIKRGDKTYQADTSKIAQELGPRFEKIERDYLDAREKQAQGLIIQLNIQRAQIQAQRNAAEAQLDIKDKYLKQSNILDMQEKFMGGLITEQHKVQLKYNKSIMKATEALERAEATANARLKDGLLRQIESDSNLQQQLKVILGSSATGGAELIQDISDKVAGMSANELINTLEEIKQKNKGNEGIQEAINKLMDTELQKRQNSIDLAKKQKTISDAQSESQKNLNQKIAEQKDLMVDVNREMQNYIRGLDNAAQSRAIASEITAARFASQPRTQEEIFAEQRRLGEERQKNIIDEYVKKSTSRNEEIIKAASSREFIEGQFKAMGGEGEIKALEKKLSLGPIANYTEINTQLNQLKSLQQSVNLAKQEEQKIMQDVSKQIKEELGLTDQKIDKERILQKIREDEYARRTGPNDVQEGMKDGFKVMASNAKTMRYEIGERIPNLLADGLAQAMQVGLNGAEDIGDAMRQIGINFLQAIQSAFLQHAAHSIVGNMGFNLARNEGGKIPRYSTGGSVPAMVTNGEYVMGRQAVNKYGGAFMHGLNVRGSAPEKFSQGGLADAFGKLGTYQDSGLGQAFRNLDRGKMNNIYSEMSKAQPRQMTMDRMKTNQMQEKSLQDFFSNPDKAQKGGPDLASKTVLNNLMDNKSIKPNPGSSGLIGNLLGGIFSIITAPFKMIGSIFGGLGRYQGGLIPEDIQKFAEGGDVKEEPEPGTLISTQGGRRYHSGRKYTKNRMSGFFYSQSGNVGLREDAEGLRNELAKEEAARRAREAKKAKKKQFIMGLVGAAASAAISYGMSGGFSGSSGASVLAEKGIPSGSVDYLMSNNPGMSEVHAQMLLSNAKNGLPGVNLNHYIPAGSPYSVGDLVGPPVTGGRYYGGPINKYASGGHISGKPGIDQIPAMLSEGEYVIRASSARKLGRSRLDQINAGRFYDGGSVSSDDETKQETSSSLGNTNNISISVNVTNGSKTGENSESSITNSGEDNRDQADKQKQMAEKIKEQVVSVIVEEQRPGGLLSKTES